jgi:hypothetical protein
MNKKIDVNAELDFQILAHLADGCAPGTTRTQKARGKNRKKNCFL